MRAAVSHPPVDHQQVIDGQLLVLAALRGGPVIAVHLRELIIDAYLRHIDAGPESARLRREILHGLVSDGLIQRVVVPSDQARSAVAGARTAISFAECFQLTAHGQRIAALTARASQRANR